MGQVPGTFTSEFLLIGSGRMARHWHHYLSLLNVPHKVWSRARSTDFELNSHLKTCSRVLLAISDDSLEKFWIENRAQTSPQTQWIHFSGSRYFPEMITCHPLMSFGTELYELSFYEKIHLTLAGTPDLRSIFPELHNPFHCLDPENLTRYHAFCVLGGNFPTLLWTEMMKGLENIGLPREASDLYLTQVLKNFLNQREKSLTGPLQRRDLETLRKNFQALTSPALKNIYKAFVESQGIQSKEMER